MWQALGIKYLGSLRCPLLASVEQSRRVAINGASGRLGGRPGGCIVRRRGGERKAAGNPERYPHVCLLVHRGPPLTPAMAGPGALSSVRDLARRGALPRPVCYRPRGHRVSVAMARRPAPARSLRSPRNSASGRCACA
jgi:hypothetical protein